VGLADDGPAGFQQPLDDDGVDLRIGIERHLRAAAGGDAGDVHQVLDGDGRSALGLAGQRRVEHPHERLQAGVIAADAGEGVSRRHA
jgi:hypothetical protein